MYLYTQQLGCDFFGNCALQADLGGTIDPCVFADAQSKQWLLFKNDGNRIGKPTNIYLCPLTSDATQVINNTLYDAHSAALPTK